MKINVILVITRFTMRPRASSWWGLGGVLIGLKGLDFQGPHSYGVLTFIESGVCLSVGLLLTHFLWAAKSHVTSLWVTDFLDTNLITDN